jgi:hypothetical protein
MKNRTKDCFSTTKEASSSENVDYARSVFEGPEKATIGGVNGSQSKFLVETWPITQNLPDAPLFSLGQDRTTITKLLALRTGLETAAEARIDVGKTKCKIENENRIKNRFISS